MARGGGRRDEAWFQDLYERHRPAVGAYCVRRVGTDSAADAVAQVFSVAWRRRNDVPDGDPARPWLFGVARRTLQHHWRSHRRARRLAEKAGVLPVEPPELPEVEMVRREEHRLVRQALSELGALDREVLTLSAWEGLTSAEIAGVVGASVAAVEKRVVRARARLAERYSLLDGSAATAMSHRGGAA